MPVDGDISRLPFAEIWVVDFEFIAAPGERPRPVCLVARELRSGKMVRIWGDELTQMRTPPYPTGQESLFVAYFASAELGCHMALDWPMPARILDLYVEHRAATNGIFDPVSDLLKWCQITSLMILTNL